MQNINFNWLWFKRSFKNFFIISNNWWHVFLIRTSDRIGKGIRTAPRDALIADSVDPKEKEKYFGLHRTMDTIGAFMGSLIVALLLWKFSENLESIIRLIFFYATITGILAIFILAVFVKDLRKENIKIAIILLLFFQYFFLK